MPGHLDQAASHTLCNWLSLHGISADDCARFLSLIPDQPKITRAVLAAQAAVPARLSAEKAWRFVTRAMTQRVPSLSATITSMAENTVVNTNPDLKKFPDPFTLHDGGNGFPYVSCRYDGGIGSLISLAHEAGHAIQITASGGNLVPPVMRETAAFLSEAVCEALIEAERPDLSKAVARHRTALDARYLGRFAKRLRDSLPLEHAAYAYVWNYPLARLLAQCAPGHLTDSELNALFSGQMKVRDLARAVFND